jgi:phage shock protein C
MTLSDELLKLQGLHERGALSDDEFAQAKARLLHAPATAGAGGLPGRINALRRSGHDRWLAGVCGGLAAATGVDAWAWRLGFALLLPFGGLGVVVYLLMWLFVPAA